MGDSFCGYRPLLLNVLFSKDNQPLLYDFMFIGNDLLSNDDLLSSGIAIAGGQYLKIEDLRLQRRQRVGSPAAAAST